MAQRFAVNLRRRDTGVFSRIVIEADSRPGLYARLRESNIEFKYEVLSVAETDEPLTTEPTEAQTKPLSDRELLERINFNLYVIATRPRVGFWTIVGAILLASLITMIVTLIISSGLR